MDIKKSETINGLSMNDEPNYYDMNGFSPLRAMKNGLISTDEYIGFLKGNVIKYVVRAGHKDSPYEDIDKAIDYLLHLRDIMGKKYVNE